MSCDLRDIGVLVTRPRGQAEALCDLIVKQGGNPIRFPAITIVPADDRVTAKETLQNITDYQIVIFISPNSVRYGLDLMDGEQLFPGVTVCAVGKGTARVLAERGVTVDIRPEGSFDSESLLAMPELKHVAEKRILIVRGNGGRRLLGDTLRQRGADVEYAEVYSREISSIDPGPLIAAWEREVDVVTATSCGILDSIFTLLGEEGRAKLRTTPLVVVSERIQARAQKLGCSSIILANEASDRGVLEAICKWSSVTSR